LLLLDFKNEDPEAGLFARSAVAAVPALTGKKLNAK